MSKRKLSRTERRRQERMQAKLQRRANRLDKTKWLGVIKDLTTGEHVRIPRIVPEVGSMWQCSIYGATFLVRGVRNDHVIGKLVFPSKVHEHLIQRLERFMRSCNAPDEMFRGALTEMKSSVYQLLNMDGRISGWDHTIPLIDFCGLEQIENKSLMELVGYLSGVDRS